MIKVTKQILVNDKVLIKITGDNRKEILQYFYYFINYGNAVKIRKGVEIEDDTGLNWIIEDKEGYFRSNCPDVIQTLVNIELFKILRQYPELDELPNKITELAQKRGIETFQNMEEENILADADNDIDME